MKVGIQKGGVRPLRLKRDFEIPRYFYTKQERMTREKCY